MKTLIEDLLTRLEQIQLSAVEMNSKPEVYLEVLKKRDVLINQLVKIDFNQLSENDKTTFENRIHKLLEKNTEWTQQMQTQIQSLQNESKKFVQGRQAARGYLSTHEDIGPGIHKFA